MSSKHPPEIMVRDRYLSEGILIHVRESPDPEATLAFQLIERWGMVAGMPDGEDAAGRAKLALLPPDKIVERAFETANLAFEAARAGGLMIELPDAETVREMGRKERERN